MASNISRQYVYLSINVIAEFLSENASDLSFETLKKIVDDSDILNNKIKVTSNSKVGGWHAYVSEHRKDNSMKKLAELWKVMSNDEKKPYIERALNMREQDKIKKEKTDNVIKKIKPDNNIKKIKPNNNIKKIKNEEEKTKVSAWVLFKKTEIKSGNLDLNNIKNKYMQLSSKEIDEIKKKYSDEINSEKNNENKNNSNCVWNIYKELQFEQGITDMGLIKENYNNLTNDEIERYKKMNE